MAVFGQDPGYSTTERRNHIVKLWNSNPFYFKSCPVTLWSAWWCSYNFYSNLISFKITCQHLFSNYPKPHQWYINTHTYTESSQVCIWNVKKNVSTGYSWSDSQFWWQSGMWNILWNAKRLSIGIWQTAPYAYTFGLERREEERRLDAILWANMK